MARAEEAEQVVEPAADTDALSDPLMSRAQGRVGRTLHDKWRLDVLLGVGGTAAVYAATHRNGSRAAVKILHPEASTNAFVRDRFLWEGYMANAVGHDAAVRVIDDDVADDGSLFLVTELLDGETLEERRVRLGGRLPAREVLLVADQLLEMLEAAHARAIVHRDLKPENVFLTREGQVKVLDFGIARHGDEASPATKRGTTIGTPAYMAPEHARGHFDELDERSDIWACGAIMFRLLSGRAVHEGGTVEEEIASAMERPAPPLASVAPDVHHAVARVVDGALAFDKEMRWTDARRMQIAVREAYHEALGSPITSAPPLTLGDGVPNRTLPHTGALAVQAPWGPSSIRAVAISKHEERRGRAAPASTHRGLLGGLALLTVASIAVAWAAVERLEVASAPRPTSIASQTVMCTPPPAVVQLSPLAPEVLADDPPTPPMLSRPSQPVPPAVRFEPSPRWVPAPSPRVASQAAPPSASLLASPAPTATSSSTESGKDCDPPYVVDWATGKQRWKLECL